MCKKKREANKGLVFGKQQNRIRLLGSLSLSISFTLITIIIVINTIIITTYRNQSTSLLFRLPEHKKKRRKKHCSHYYYILLFCELPNRKSSHINIILKPEAICFQENCFLLVNVCELVCSCCTYAFSALYGDQLLRQSGSAPPLVSLLQPILIFVSLILEKGEGFYVNSITKCQL